MSRALKVGPHLPTRTTSWPADRHAAALPSMHGLDSLLPEPSRQGKSRQRANPRLTEESVNLDLHIPSSQHRRRDREPRQGQAGAVAVPMKPGSPIEHDLLAAADPSAHRDGPMALVIGSRLRWAGCCGPAAGARLACHGAGEARRPRRSRLRVAAGRLHLRRRPDHHHGALHARGALGAGRPQALGRRRTAADGPVLPHPLRRRQLVRLQRRRGCDAQGGGALQPGRPGRLRPVRGRGRPVLPARIRGAWARWRSRPWATCSPQYRR